MRRCWISVEKKNGVMPEVMFTKFLLSGYWVLLRARLNLGPKLKNIDNCPFYIADCLPNLPAFVIETYEFHLKVHREDSSSADE